MPATILFLECKSFVIVGIYTSISEFPCGDVRLMCGWCAVMCGDVQWCVVMCDDVRWCAVFRHSLCFLFYFGQFVLLVLCVLEFIRQNIVFVYATRIIHSRMLRALYWWKSTLQIWRNGVFLRFLMCNYVAYNHFVNIIIYIYTRLKITTNWSL